MQEVPCGYLLSWGEINLVGKKANTVNALHLACLHRCPQKALQPKKRAKKENVIGIPMYSHNQIHYNETEIKKQTNENE